MFNNTTQFLFTVQISPTSVTTGNIYSIRLFMNFCQHQTIPKQTQLLYRSLLHHSLPHNLFLCSVPRIPSGLISITVSYLTVQLGN